jgi:hypothetical protein
MEQKLDILKMLSEKSFPDFTGSIEIHMCNGEVGQINQKVSRRYVLKKKVAQNVAHIEVVI